MAPGSDAPGLGRVLPAVAGALGRSTCPSASGRSGARAARRDARVRGARRRARAQQPRRARRPRAVPAPPARRLDAADLHASRRRRRPRWAPSGSACRRAGPACSGTPSATPPPATLRQPASAGPGCPPARRGSASRRSSSAGRGRGQRDEHRARAVRRLGADRAALRGAAYRPPRRWRTGSTPPWTRCAARASRTCTGATSTRRATATAGARGSGATRSRELDAELGGSRRLVPRDTVLVVTADHGMVDVDRAQRWDVATDARARRRRRAASRGSRARCTCTSSRAADPADVAERWRGDAGRRGGRRDPRGGDRRGLVRRRWPSTSGRSSGTSSRR